MPYFCLTLCLEGTLQKMIVLAQNLQVGDFILRQSYANRPVATRMFYNGLVTSPPRAGTDDSVRCDVLSSHNLTIRPVIFDYEDECEILR